MSQSRIDIFTEMTHKNPDDAMVWYGLATEHSKLERWSEAVEALRNVVRIKPDYTAAYQMLGAALHNQGLNEDARRAWIEGVAVAERTGAWKAKRHMEGLLAGLDGGGGFCA
jgi:Flp pilus assembly protein TadD